MTDTNDLTLVINDLSDLPDVEIKTSCVLQDSSRPDLIGVSGFLHPNGAIRNGQGHYIVKPAWSAGAWTGDSARAAVKKREALRSEAVQAAIISGTGVKPGDLAGGIGELAGELVKIVTKKSSQDRDKISAFKEIMRFAGLAYDLGRGSSGDPGGQGAASLSPAALAALNTILPAIEARINIDNS